MSKYIIFEGVDGSGKTSLARMVYDLLPEPRIFTKEPGSPHLKITVEIRNLILNGADQFLTPDTYAYLFAADREEHLDKVVLPSIRDDKYVVSDRSIFSDFAYRPHNGNSVRKEHLKKMLKLNPIVFMIETDPKVCLNRMTSRGELNEYEKNIVADRIHEIHDNYYKYSLPKYENGIINIIDNNKSLEESYKEVVKCLSLYVPDINK